jgi:hypothetical protein
VFHDQLPLPIFITLAVAALIAHTPPQKRQDHCHLMTTIPS